MDNQHRKIHGYRELSETDIKLMNEIKALGPIIETVIDKVNDHISKQTMAAYNDKDNKQDGTELARLEAATPSRFAALAKTDFQVALMQLTRAVAQPTFF